MNMFSTEHRIRTRLLVTLLAMAMAFFLTAWANRFIDGQTMLILLTAVIFCALFSGFWFGIGAAIIGALGHNLFFQIPKFTVRVDSKKDVLDLVIFLAMSVFMSCVGSNLRKARQDAERAANSMEKVLAVISHDVRNPMTVAKTSIELLKRPQETAGRREWLATKAVESLDRVDKMIKSLLDAHLIRSGKQLTLDFKNCDAKEMVSEIIADLSLVYGDRIRLHASGSFLGYWSQDGIQRALENLIANAVKYGEPTAPITVNLKDEGDSISLGVHNYGTAIPKPEQKELFTVFHRTAASRRDRKQGWGIGLAVVKGVAEAHGGSVLVDSAPKQGTTFSIRLPKSNSQVNDLYNERRVS